MPNRNANEVTPSSVYSKYLQPKCYVAVRHTTREKLEQGRSLPKWTMVHLLARMRKKEGCNIPSRVRYQRGTITANNTNTVQRALNKMARGHALTREEENAHRLAAHRGARRERRTARRAQVENHPPNLVHNMLPPNNHGNNHFNFNAWNRQLNRAMEEHRLAQARNKNKNNNNNNNSTEALIRRFLRSNRNR